VAARSWGEGAEWSLDQLPRLLGAADDPRGFRPRLAHGPLVEAWQRYAHYRVGRTEAVFEALAPACIEQVVTGKEAFRAWRLLVREFGEPAPGPAREPGSAAYGMYLPPTPEVWSRVPSWRFLAAGVEQRRSRTLVRTASRAASLERTLSWPYEQADRALRSFPGVGPWTSAEVRQRAHGDPDAWSIGDYHVGRDITYLLTGEELDDDACLEILESYRGHRFRVQMLLSMVGRRRPRRAPRMSLPTHTPYATRGRS
jgi:3-methyladenine DNA glycosylase/8-oxoguanine DNA glycosylase